MIFIYLQSCIHHLKGLFESNLVTCFLLVHIRTVIYSDIYLIPLPHFTTPQNFYSYCNNWKLLITVANYEWTYVQIRWTIHQTTWLLKRKSLNLHNQISAFIFSILFFIHLQGITEENLVQNQQLFMFAIISLILMSLMFDSAPIPL